MENFAWDFKAARQGLVPSFLQPLDKAIRMVATKDVGAYLLNLMELKDGKLVGSQVVGANINYSPEFNAAGPNNVLLRRIVESGGGKLLNPSVQIDNPFLHNRIKTFQPRDLWEWLLQLAIILFTLDVGIRRVQIDREEWMRATENLRRLIFFWKPAVRPAQADESLAALLARRDSVRANRPQSVAEPKAELFRPVSAAAPIDDLRVETGPEPAAEPSPVEAPPAAEEPAPANTTSRLLEAKRRAQKRRSGGQ
jgi:hypothetical protein